MGQPPRFNQRPASSIAAISDRRMSLHEAVGKIIPRLARIACKKETRLADPHLLLETEPGPEAGQQSGEIVGRERLSGLLKYYHRQAA
jgi:hypothetical protein